MEPEGSSPHSQVPTTCPYPEQARTSPHSQIPLTESYLRLGLPSGLFPSGFPNKTLYTLLLSPHTRYMPRPSHSYFFLHSFSFHNFFRFHTVHQTCAILPFHTVHLTCAILPFLPSPVAHSHLHRVCVSKQKQKLNSWLEVIIGGDCVGYCLLGCDSMQSCGIYRRVGSTCYHCLQGLYVQYGDIKSHQRVSVFLPDWTASYPINFKYERDQQISVKHSSWLKS